MDYETSVVSIYSTRDVDGLGPACRIVWGPFDVYAGVTDVRATAEDLFTCAAYAELIEEMLQIGLDRGSVARFLSAAMSKSGRRFMGTQSTLQPMPVGSSQRKIGMVQISRGSMQQALTPDEARGMGRAWLEAAEASEQDTLFDTVLRRAEWLSPEELEALFGVLRDLREEWTAP